MHKSLYDPLALRNAPHDALHPRIEAPCYVNSRDESHEQPVRYLHTPNTILVSAFLDILYGLAEDRAWLLAR
jgi:hypothetical protein